MIKTKRGVGYAKSREFIEVQVSRSDDYKSESHGSDQT